METCKACSVKINHKDEVLFAYGKPGTKARLHVRVCQFAKNKKDCINKDFDGAVNAVDRWDEDPFV